MEELLEAILEANDFIKKVFGFELKETQLKIYNEEQWNKFCERNSFNKNSDGIFIPQSMIAYVKLESIYLIINMYHEFFGHGLFCEYSLIGRKLRTFYGKQAEDYLYSPNSNKQFGITNYNILEYEGFAMWLEELLSEETGYYDLFQKKMDEMPKINKKLLDYFRKAEQELTTFGFLSQMGFPKHYTPKTLDSFLREKYKHYDDTELILLYGSKKPYSDIDLFVISDTLTKNYFNGWLDIYEVNKKDFIYLLKLLDISITDPLFTGILVKGEESLLKEYKEKIIYQTITKEAIKHNEMMSKNQLILSYYDNLSERERKIAKSYALTYSLNAQYLKKGIKCLTKQNLLKKCKNINF